MKIDCIIPSYRNVKTDCFQALIGVVNHTRESGHDAQLAEIYSNSYPHWARNDGISRIRPDCEAVLFCDDDMLPERDALVRLINADMPVVSGLCTSRGFPVKLCLMAYDVKGDTFKAVESIAEHEGNVMVGKLAVGAAFLLVKRQVLEDVAAQWLSAHDWLEDNREAFDRMRVSKFQREQERQRIAGMRAEFVTSGANRANPVIFNLKDTDSGYQFGEDVGFCRRCIQLGYPIAVDTTVQVGHVGDFPYHPMHMGVKHNREIDIRETSAGELASAVPALVPLASESMVTQ